MATALSLTKVRADLYKIVDRVLETGNPVEIERRGKRVRIVPVRPKSKLDNLVKRPGTLVGDPEDIVHMDWSDEWAELRKRKKRR
jgi:prevent-host-death family protein